MTSPVLFVVPTLGKRPEWLIETVASIRAQGDAACDLVIVAPSTVDSLFLSLRPGERVVRCDAPGVAKALNVVWMHCAEDYEFLAWLGDDDLLAPGSLAATTEALRGRTDAVAAYGQIDYIHDNGALWYTAHPTRLAPRYLKWGKNFLPQPGSLLRREAVRSAGWLDESLMNSFDQSLFTRLANFGPVIYLPKVVASYRVHTASITATKGLHDESDMVRRSVHRPIGRVVYSTLRPLTRLIDQLVYSTQSRLYGARRRGVAL
jgi:glycosyltransferase involved in cell wall biosynthesis